MIDTVITIVSAIAATVSCVDAYKSHKFAKNTKNLLDSYRLHDCLELISKAIFCCNEAIKAINPQKAKQAKNYAVNVREKMAALIDAVGLVKKSIPSEYIERIEIESNVHYITISQLDQIMSGTIRGFSKPQNVVSQMKKTLDMSRQDVDKIVSELIADLAK